MPTKKGEAKAGVTAEPPVMRSGECVLVGPGPLPGSIPEGARVVTFATSRGAGKVVRFPGDGYAHVLLAGVPVFQLSLTGARALSAAIEALENDPGEEA